MRLADGRPAGTRRPDEAGCGRPVLARARKVTLDGKLYWQGAHPRRPDEAGRRPSRGHTEALGGWLRPSRVGACPDIWSDDESHHDVAEQQKIRKQMQHNV